MKQIVVLPNVQNLHMVLKTLIHLDPKRLKSLKSI